MSSNQFGPGQPNANHTREALAQRQSAARLEDANASAHPNTVTVAELQARTATRR